MKKFISMLMICLVGLAANQKATAQEAFTQTASAKILFYVKP